MQAIGSLNAEVVVEKNDSSLLQIIEHNPTHLILSPGPGNPSHSGISKEALKYFQSKIPILGVCLGLQIIGECHGAKLGHAETPIHGQVEQVHHNGEGLFKGLKSPTPMARYHSLILSSQEWPELLEKSAWTEKGEIMGLRHKSISHLYGVQFHPESFMSDEGPTLIRNFLNVG